MIIADPIRLREVVDEIATTWTVDQRRSYLVNLETAFGAEAAQQMRDALSGRWAERKSK